MNEKEATVIREELEAEISTQGLAKDAYSYVVLWLERQLKERPFWLKLFHYIKGNASWIRKKVQEAIQKWKELEENKKKAEEEEE